MNVRAGDVRQFILAGREMDPAPESNWNVKIVNFENESAPTGNGQLHTTQARTLPGIGDCAISCDQSRDDHEYIKSLNDDGEAFPVSLTLVDGTTYAGELAIDGEVQHATGDGTVGFSLRGAKFEKI